jgi:EAL domain-containing protein (putative c-di-GMP-specific phosphodiesterase class I)
MDDPQRALGTLNGLSGLGFKLSIDDFGTGYSSLAYLKRLPVDELKIDKSFVLNMVEDLDDAKIVRSTIDLAHNLGLTVVAEGVENAKVWDMLRDLDCDEAQGYHMGRPMPASEFFAWSTAWTAKNRPRPPAASAFMLH